MSLIVDWTYGSGAPLGGGACDYPAESDVVEGVSYGSGLYTGTYKKYSVATEASDDIRTQIVAVLDARLKSITTANGYETNAGNNVFAWRDTERKPMAASELPCVLYRDREGVEEEETVGGIDHTLNVEMELFAATAATLRQLRADAIRCIGTDLQFSTLADQATPPRDASDVVLHADDYFTMTMTFSVEYRTARFDPYTQ
jgi:hypothetical protein